MKKSKIILIILLSIFTASCARAVRRPPEEYPTREIYPPSVPSAKRGEIQHEVGPGETIWRISKMYDVKMSDIIKANNLKDASKIKTGQILIIPNAGPLRPVIPLYPSSKWKFIIIHHTATDEGNALKINRMHINRGWQGLGYHFLMDNGTYGKKDGQIEVSPRWLKQQDGAHCNASGMNSKGIGIGLVGNFSVDKVSKNQMDSLVYLTKILMRYYRIPLKNVLGHGQVPGAATECPGKKFPWKELKQLLK
ncbi:MAG: N-acetylmuramoyl-L-alanine amidase [Candidatus Omnitrophota bacterium]